MSAFDVYLQDETLCALRAQLRLLGEKGRFRSGLYASAELRTLDDLNSLPFTDSVDIILSGKDMLCVSPRDVARIASHSFSMAACFFSFGNTFFAHASPGTAAMHHWYLPSI